MVDNFCTLFDKNYLYKGLAMYNSLAAQYQDRAGFVLWILCLDDQARELLGRLSLPGVRLVSLSEFEDEALLTAKANRNAGEYAWTCASNFIWFLLQRYPDISQLTYLDADLYFFDDPRILLAELGDKDILITSHRYTKRYDQSTTSGRYCVQFMVFRNNDRGRAALDWWRRACLDWCFSYLDQGRFGDQKYLDDWPTRFSGVHELQHLGGGVAPWNVQQYRFKKEAGEFVGRRRDQSSAWPLIFYHFHSFCLLSPRRAFFVRGYDLPRDVRRMIYGPYFLALQASISQVGQVDPDFKAGFKSVSSRERLVSGLLRCRLLSPLVRVYRVIRKKYYDKKN
jgi:hypothetical protein